MRINNKKFRRITACIVFSAVIFTAGSLSAMPDFVYNAQLNVRTGYHQFSESDSWIDSKKKMMDDDLFFRDENYNPENNMVYYSDNVNTNVSNARTGMPMLSLEAVFGISLDKLPYMDRINALKGFSGFRVGLGCTFYPFSSMEETYHSGSIVYTNTEAVAPNPSTLNYKGEIKIEETINIIAPSLNFYYFYEEGFSWRAFAHRLVPYGGLEMGYSFLSGKRKLTLTSKSLYVASNDTTYQVDASIQESFFNATSFRFGLLAGGQLHIGGRHYIDSRIGFIYQETSVSLVRRGSWNESVGTATYSRKVQPVTRNVSFSQTGFYFTIGYTVGLL